VSIRTDERRHHEQLRKAFGQSLEHPQREFSTKIAAFVIVAVAIGFALGQLSVIRACFGF
jgi:hypothetical protein